MTRVTDIAQNTNLRGLMQQISRDLGETRAQVSSGKVATDYSGLGTVGALASIEFRQDIQRYESLIGGLRTALPRVETMDTVLNEMVATTRQVFDDNLIHPRDNEPPLAIIRDQAQRALASITTKLNTSLDGRFLFASRDIRTAPMADATVLDTAVQTEIAAYMAGTQTGADVLTNVNALTGAQHGYSATLLGLPAADGLSVLVEQNLSVDYTVRADAQGIQEVLRGLSVLANLQYDPAQDAEFWTIFEGAQALLESGARGIDQQVAQLGLVGQQMEQAVQQHGDTQTMLQRFVSDAEDVDMAEAISRMQQLQTQLQASYQTFSTLRDLTLVNFIR